MQHAAHEHCIVMCGLSGPTIFSTLSDKWHDLKKAIGHKMGVLIFFSAFV
jgi:hypothetical protein